MQTPTVPTPIPSSARVCIEFIPAHQDAETYERLKTEELREREQALERRRTTVIAADGPDDPVAIHHREALAETEREIMDDWTFMRRNLQTMRDLYPEPQRFIISVPTTVEREQINSRLIRMGMRPVSQEETRATMIMEMFEYDWSGGDADQNLVIAEDNANFLDSCFMRQEAHDQAVRAYEAQERERFLDEMNGAPYRPAEPAPVRILTVREQARMTLLISEMMKTARMRDIAAKASDFARSNARLLVKLHLRGTNFIGDVDCSPGADWTVDPQMNAISDETVDAVRNAVDEKTWTALVQFIDRYYVLDQSEEKNSVSPLAKSPDPSGSAEPSDAPESNGGTSKRSTRKTSR